MSHKSFSHLTDGYQQNDSVNLRLAILGAPGAGKSTLAAGLLYFCKLFFFKVDSVPEVAKWHLYKGTDFKTTDYEINKYNEQKALEDLYPKGLDVLICEAPLTISAVYSAYYNGDESEVTNKIMTLVGREKKRYTHYIVSRKLARFEAFGRNETEKQSDEIHKKTLEVLERLQLNYVVINQYEEHIPIQLLAMLGAVRKRESFQVQPGRDNLPLS